MFGNGLWYGIGGQTLSWQLANASVDMNFAGGNYFGGTLSTLLSTSRASTGYATNSDGTLTSFAANTARIGSGTGLLVEEARTNVVLWNRDLTNAAWTKSNVTAAKDQVGADGTANGASSIIATAGNGTCLQAITLASAAAFQSAYVKRLVGSGVIQMTMDNGATWTAITVTSSYTQLTIPTQTLANPTVGFRIVTNGDQIAVDLVQNENSGSFATSPIPTTTVAVTRAADIITAPGIFNAYTPTNTVVAYIKHVNAGQLISTLSIDDGTFHERIQWMDSGDNVNYRLAVEDDGGTFSANNAIGAMTAGVDKLAVAIAPADVAAYLNGAQTFTSAVLGTPVPKSSLATARIGVSFANNAPWLNGYVLRLAFFTSRIPNATLAAFTT